MQSGKQPVNCTPCAKRKVRCDRNQPCYHCKRRKGDVCVYPVRGARNGSDGANERIEKLEAYIKRLGGDPMLVEQNIIDDRVDFQSSEALQYPKPEIRRTEEAPSAIGNGINMSKGSNADRLPCVKLGLKKHDEQIDYTEVPMWYSFSGVKKPGEEPQPSLPAQSHTMKPESRLLYCFPTLFDPTNVTSTDLYETCPMGTEMITLWKQYLKNVHPLVMIFFDWEIEHIIIKASRDITSLTHGEQTLVSAILLITATSLSEEQCLDSLHEEKSQSLARFQKAVEDSLIVADFIVTSDRLVLQAFMLYLLVMNLRARPAVVFSLLGIASRIAHRMGLHRDGDACGISVLRSEERRRMWWQLQHMEIAVAQSVGSFTPTIYADWDTKLPSNLNDRALRADMQALPVEPRGLTDMSHCLWRYQILHLQRASPVLSGSKDGLAWLLSPHVPLTDKDASIDITERTLNEKFVQYCEPLEPLHTLLQIGVRSFILAARRVSRQPALVNAKISEMSTRERDDFLGICMKALEYFILLQKTESLRGFQWHSEVYSQWPAFVYVILEAHHRYDKNTVEDLWSLISRVYATHPKLKRAVHSPEILATVRITLVAWHRRHTYVEHKQHWNRVLSSNEYSTPAWISDLCQRFELPEVSSTFVSDPMSQELVLDTSQLLPLDFDFDSMDWSFWEDLNFDVSLNNPDP